MIMGGGGGGGGGGGVKTLNLTLLSFQYTTLRVMGDTHWPSSVWWCFPWPLLRDSADSTLSESVASVSQVPVPSWNPNLKPQFSYVLMRIKWFSGNELSELFFHISGFPLKLFLDHNCIKCKMKVNYSNVYIMEKFILKNGKSNFLQVTNIIMYYLDILKQRVHCRNQ